MGIAKDAFGATSEGKVERYTLKNINGMSAQVITYGAIITSLNVPGDVSGNPVDVVLGFDTLAEYEARHPYFGAIIGRVANRTEKGRFTLEGKLYTLAVNNGPNHLHGGKKGFDKVLWKAHVEGDKLCLSYTSEDMEEGYPGALTANVTYELTNENELKINYVATTTITTPVNLTNHSYFNLNGHNSGNVKDHLIKILAEQYTPVDETSIPTGETAAVDDTVFDLRKAIVIGDRINNIPGSTGFDHNFCVAKDVGDLKLIAKVEHRGSGRTMDVYTNQPGVQFYTANYVKDVRGKSGAVYNQHAALCLETQNYPNAINRPNFPNSVLKPGSTYQHSTVYQFSW